MRKVRKGKIIACLDIGSSNLVCIIASLLSDGEVKVMGHALKESKGITGGAISDMKLAHKSIVAAVSEAERMANINIEKLLINISGSVISSDRIEEKIKISSNIVKSPDIANLANKVRSSYRKNSKEMIHLIPMEYRIDDSMPVQNPRLMSGGSLYAKFHAISTPRTNILNIENCLRSCQISVNNYIFESYANYLSSVNENEKAMGNLVINIGGDVTSFAIVIDGKMIYSGGFVMAGNHITKDVATILGVSLEYAEKIKNLNSTLILSQGSQREIVKYRISNNDEPSMIKMTKGDLREIIKCRLEEILEIIKKSINDAKIPDFVYNNIIITGGTSNIIGIDQLANKIFSRNVRLSYPFDLQGISNVEDLNKPEFATSLGMIIFLKNLIVKEKIKSGFEYHESSWLKKIIEKIIDY